jgi:succinoglycan biosynthesis protein ExoV
MRLFWYVDKAAGKRQNFGDALNGILWYSLLGRDFFRDDETDDSLFVGVGTLLNSSLPVAKTTIIAGAGVGYAAPPRGTVGWNIYGLRGPLSAQKLGVDSRLAITDPALLCRHVWPNGFVLSQDPDGAIVANGALQKPHKSFAISYMPHATDARLNGAMWRELSEQCGVHYIDPCDPLDVVLNDILQSEELVTEAMHGAIVADAYRVPWSALCTSREILEFKWRDWLQSVELGDLPMPRIRRPMYLLNRSNWLRRCGLFAVRMQVRTAFRRSRPQHSRTEVSMEREERLIEMVERLRRDRREGVI